MTHEIYAFRATASDVPDRFHQTLLREWIAPQYQEAQLASPPAFASLSVPGAEGAFYRAYDDLRTPGGDIRRFDFDNAEQTDPVNSGHYVVQGARLIVTMGERDEETITVPLPQDGRLTINAVEYRRQR